MFLPLIVWIKIFSSSNVRRIHYLKLKACTYHILRKSTTDEKLNSNEPLTNTIVAYSSWI